MATTLRIINEEGDTTVAIAGCVADSEHLKELQNGYVFYKEYISHDTKATEEDFFADNCNLIAVKHVGADPFTLLGVTMALWQWIAVSAIVVGGLAISFLAKPKLGMGFNQSSNNSLGNRGNQVRLGDRIEDMWGTVPKAYPSLLSSFTRFDDNRDEVECSILCLGRGKYNIQDVRDNDYLVENITTTKCAAYNPGVAIGSTPSTTFTVDSPSFPPLLLKQVGQIASFELGKETGGRFLIGKKGSISYIDGTYDGWSQLKPTPYLKCISETVIETWYEYEKTFELTGCGVTDWTTTIFADGGDISFEGFTKATNGVAAYYGDCSAIRATIISVVPSKMTFKVRYNTIPIRNRFWDQIAVGATVAPTFTRHNNYPNTKSYSINYPSPPGLAYQDPSMIESFIAGDRAAIYVLGNFRSDRIIIDYQNDGTASYVSNFVCDTGTAGGNNIAVLTVAYASGANVTEEFLCPADKDKTRRVGYSHTKTYTYSETEDYPVYFTWHSATDVNSFVLRDVYRYEDMSTFADSGVTIIRVERRYSKYFGASNEMKLSCKATREVGFVSQNPDGTWYFNGAKTSSEGTADKLAIVVANLHCDEFNGRRTPTSLDYSSLIAAQTALEEYTTSTVGITFDDDSSKYEEELKQLVSGLGCLPYQVGSKIYTFFEKATPTVDLMFTHRDYDVTSFVMTRVFRQEQNHDGIELTYKTGVPVSGYYGDDYVVGDDVILYLPQDTTLTNPKEIKLNAIHTEEQANLTLYREYYKLLYNKKNIRFNAYSLGRQACPGMVVAVADNTRANKSDGEIIATFTESGYTYIETSQYLMDGITDVLITDQEGNVTSYSATKAGEFILRFNSTVPSDIYTGWTQMKTRYIAYTSSYDKYIVTNVEVKSYDEVEITAINYDGRYYQQDTIL